MTASGGEVGGLSKKEKGLMDMDNSVMTAGGGRYKAVSYTHLRAHET